jgi:hypothetical protein
LAREEIISLSSLLHQVQNADPWFPTGVANFASDMDLKTSEQKSSASTFSSSSAVSFVSSSSSSANLIVSHRHQQQQQHQSQSIHHGDSSILLSLLHQRLTSESLNGAFGVGALFLQIFLEVFQPYLRLLSLWLFAGHTNEDGYGEFMVIEYV